jgi:hypothetical protein
MSKTTRIPLLWLAFSMHFRVYLLNTLLILRFQAKPIYIGGSAPPTLLVCLKFPEKSHLCLYHLHINLILTKIWLDPFRTILT